MTEPDATDEAPARRTVEPVQVDSSRVVAVGTLVWAIALVALLPFTDTLREDGRLWWLAACGCGIALGLAGLLYLRRKK